MAPSSTPFAASRRDVLAARDARQLELDRRRGHTLVAASLAIPGAEKVPAGAAQLFTWASRRVMASLPGARSLHAASDALGPFELWAAPGTALDAKRRCVEIEASRPVARLIDLDVYDPHGACLDRATLHLAPRRCLCCPRPANECVRLGRHELGELAARARGLLVDLGDLAG
jgi:holo-ACP synthase CitX